jgi:hypothetical protein
MEGQRVGVVGAQSLLLFQHKTTNTLHEANLLQAGVNALVDGNYAIAWDKFGISAELGNPNAYYYMSHMYLYGIGTEPNKAKAEEHGKIALEIHDDQSQPDLDPIFLGRLLETGLAGELDYKVAHDNYQTAASLGNDIAYVAIAAMAERGLGMPGSKPDLKTAQGWYKRASESEKLTADQLAFVATKLDQISNPLKAGIAFMDAGDYDAAKAVLNKLHNDGDLDAPICLGHMYEQGLGVTKDTKEAENLYHIAATRGNSLGKYHLGRLFENSDNSNVKKQAIAYFKDFLVDPSALEDLKRDVSQRLSVLTMPKEDNV